MTFEDWYKDGGFKYGPEAHEWIAKAAWEAATKTEREACAKVCDEIAMKHQREDGTYAAGKKAGAFECAETLRSNA